MQIDVQSEDGVALIHMKGEFDAMTSPRFKEAVDGLLERRIHQLVVNLGSVTFINSSSLGLIIKTKGDLVKRGGNLVVSCPSSFCGEIMKQIRFDRVVAVFGSDDEARAGLVIADG